MGKRASRRRTRRRKRACGKKQRFETLEDANKAARPGCLGYLCKYCGKYHYGNT